MIMVSTLKSLLSKVPAGGRVSAHVGDGDAGLLVDCPDGQQYWFRARDTNSEDTQDEFKQSVQNAL